MHEYKKFFLVKKDENWIVKLKIAIYLILLIINNSNVIQTPGKEEALLLLLRRGRRQEDRSIRRCCRQTACSRLRSSTYISFYLAVYFWDIKPQVHQPAPKVRFSYQAPQGDNRVSSSYAPQYQRRYWSHYLPNNSIFISNNHQGARPEIET